MSQPVSTFEKVAESMTGYDSDSTIALQAFTQSSGSFSDGQIMWGLFVASVCSRISLNLLVEGFEDQTVVWNATSSCASFSPDTYPNHVSEKMIES